VVLGKGYDLAHNIRHLFEGSLSHVSRQLVHDAPKERLPVGRRLTMLLLIPAALLTAVGM
jgi:hypothetical protein